MEEGEKSELDDIVSSFLRLREEDFEKYKDDRMKELILSKIERKKFVPLEKQSYNFVYDIQNIKETKIGIVHEAFRMAATTVVVIENNFFRNSVYSCLYKPVLSDGLTKIENTKRNFLHFDIKDEKKIENSSIRTKASATIDSRAKIGRAILCSAGCIAFCSLTSSYEKVLDPLDIPQNSFDTNIGSDSKVNMDAVMMQAQVLGKRAT